MMQLVTLSYPDNYSVIALNISYIVIVTIFLLLVIIRFSAVTLLLEIRKKVAELISKRRNFRETKILLFTYQRMRIEESETAKLVWSAFRNVFNQWRESNRDTEQLIPFMSEIYIDVKEDCRQKFKERLEYAKKLEREAKGIKEEEIS